LKTGWALIPNKNIFWKVIFLMLSSDANSY